MEVLDKIQSSTSNNKKQATLLEHLELIVEFVKDSGLNKEFFQLTEESINFVAEKMNLSAIQTVLFSIFIEKSDDYKISHEDISYFIDCKIIKTLSLSKDFDELVKRRLIRRINYYNEICYRVPKEVVNALIKNRVYIPKKNSNLSTNDLFIHIGYLFDELGKDEISTENLLEELQVLLDGSPKLSFCRQIKKYQKKLNNKDYYLMLLFFCHRYVNMDDDKIALSEINDLFEEKWTFQEIKKYLQNINSSSMLNGIVEFSNSGEFGDKNHFMLTNEAKEKLFADLNINIQQGENKKGLILSEDITPKQLFFNKRERRQIEQLSSLLEFEKFVSVQEKLVANGMRKGFACLFYGAPGTGKTETVYQIARETRRDIMMVDIAETKSMWFGESEKRIKGIFDKYRAFLKTNEHAPILLFNEADAIIGKRKEIGKSSVDQTENAIQNIILQEMENLEGIMIATTNLTQNLDKAFERRFLYKIEFEKPDIEAKEKIWHAMLPSLSENGYAVLARNFDFSGGQIENIVRKFTVDCILNGSEPSFDTILEYCKGELLYKNNGRVKIGYY